MSTELTTTGAGQPISAETMELVIGKGNLSNLTSTQRVEYLGAVCKSMGLNPLTRPIQLISLDGKTVPYATRDCTDQLRRIHNVSITIVDRQTFDDIYVVTARATLPDGRQDESTGAVSMGTTKGEARCNLLLKAESKAKRRVTLSICGLGFIDESEVASVQVATAKPAPATPDVPWTTKGGMLAEFAAQKLRVGDEAYYLALGAEGVDEPADLTATPEDRAKAARIWGALRLLDVPEVEVVA